MIYVNVEGIKDGGGYCASNTWVDTNELHDAIDEALIRFHRTWFRAGYRPPVTYNITVAGENSPRRTKMQGYPLPVKHECL